MKPKNIKRRTNTKTKGSHTAKYFYPISLKHDHRRKSTHLKRKVLHKGSHKKRASFKKKISKIFTLLFGIGFFTGLILLIVLGVYLKWVENSLPSPDKLISRKSDQSTEIFDRNGKLLYTIYGDQNREFVPLEEIPDHLKWAVLASEDIDFYQHKGIDLPGIARSIYANLVLHRPARGASTITQQLVKNTLLYDLLGNEAYEKTVLRKVKEILITMQVEQTMTKDEILQMYLNEVAFGGVNYGVQAASKAYFGKDVKDLDLAESAMLASVIPAPSRYSPIYGSNPELGKQHQEFILDQMLKHKDKTGITEEEVKKAKQEELTYKSADIDITAPHFVFYVKQQLEKEFGIDRVERGGLKVTTTLDLATQKIAEDEIRKGIKKYGVPHGAHNGAMVVLDPHTGQILAMVGSVDYFNTKDKRIDGNVNITTSLRQMGSSVKPYTYLTLFHQKYGPWLETPDLAEIKFGRYDPPNWDMRNYGPMVARQALVQSRNVPAVYSQQLAGTENVIETMQKMGISTLRDPSQYGLSLTLGTAEMKLLEHAQGFSVFATGGLKRPATGILEVKDSTGKILEKFEQKEERVFDEKEIYSINWILCDLGGFGDQPLKQYYYIKGKRALCGKTGTTNGPKDLVAMQYHKNLVVAVWTGNNNNKIMGPNAWSTTVPLPIAHSFMERVADKYKPELFSRPAGILSTTVCNDTGRIPSSNTSCKKVKSIYISGKAPARDTRKQVKLCKDTGLISTNPEQAAKYDLLENAILLDYKLENAHQRTAYEKYMQKRKNVKYLFEKPDEGECKLPLGPDNAPIISIISPTQNSSVFAGDTITINSDIRVLNNVSTLVYKLDSTDIATITGPTNSYTATYTIPESTTDGIHTINAVVTDDQGKTSTDSIQINVQHRAPEATLEITTPTNNEVISTLPVTLQATISNGTVDRVVFRISGNNGYTWSGTDTTPEDGISIEWNDNSTTNGVYTVTATGINGTDIITSSGVTFILNR